MSDNISVSSVDDVFIHLVSSDEKTLAVNLKAAKKSSVVSGVIDATTADSSTSPVNIPLPMVASKELQKIIAFLEHHKNDSINKAEWEEKLTKNEVPDFDLNLVGSDVAAISDLMLAADFMDIQPLVALCAWKMAQEIKKCQSASEIIAAFDEKVSDFTSEEIETVRTEHAWYTKQ